MHQLFWIASRAFGTTAMVLLGVSVAAGLAMSGKLLARPGLTARVRRFHEAATLVTLALIAVHAGLLLFDTYLRPGLTGILVPFTMGYRSTFTGLGVIAAWLAAVLGLSYYARRRIGARRWRKLHRFTIVVYVLALVHVIGSGTDIRSPWMLATLTGLTAPVAFGLTYRLLGAWPSGHSPRRSQVALR